MENVFYEKEICEYCNIPSIPKKQWDGKSSFKQGCAVVELIGNTNAYAVCTFDSDVDKEPRIIKVFASVAIKSVGKIFPVPNYMDTNIEESDLDEHSKEAAQNLIDEANKLAGEDNGEENGKTEIEPQNPWCFDEIHNMEEATAWLTQYNQSNGIRGRIPTNVENMQLKLLALYNEIHPKGKEEVKQEKETDNNGKEKQEAE